MKLKISPPTAIILILLAFLDRSFYSLVPISAAFLHECGHLIALRSCKVGCKSIELTLFGAEIRTLPRQISRCGRVFILSAGALANLISGIIADCFGLEFFALCSFALAVVNMLPIRSLDGGELLAALLESFESGELLLNYISAFFIFVMWLLSIVLLLRFGNLSLYMLSVYLFVSIYLYKPIKASRTLSE